MATVAGTRDIRSPAEIVFGGIGGIRDVGGHTAELSSMAVIGSTLKLGTGSEQPTGLGATYRYSGRMMGLSLDVCESVIEYVPNREGSGAGSAYEMLLAVEPRSASSSRLTTSTAYDGPRSPLRRLIGRLLAGPYSRWCPRQMVGNARRALERRAKLIA